MPDLLPNIIVSVETEPWVEDAAVPEPGWLAGAIRHGLAQALKSDAAGQVSLLITDDATVRELNRTYRGLDETTDVLSFSAEHGGHWEGPSSIPDDCKALHDPLMVSLSNHEPQGEAVLRQAQDERMEVDFPIPDDEPPPIGDIVISLPQAKRQAEQQNTPLCRELALLLVHGALHLLGHDHYDDGERRVMQDLEQRALSAIFGPSEG